MWICREKERKKKDKHWSNGQVSTDLAITDSDRNGEREEQLVDWCLWLKSDWGFSFLKWIAAVVLNAALHTSALACWDASMIICACINVCVCAFMHVRDHIYTISECLPRRRPIRQADRFIRREPGGCRAAAGAKPTEIARSVCKSARLVTGLAIGPTSSPPYLCHLWLQHQRFRTHPRNVYVDLTATWERMC